VMFQFTSGSVFSSYSCNMLCTTHPLDQDANHKLAFGAPIISLEWVELSTLYLVCKLITAITTVRTVD